MSKYKSIHFLLLLFTTNLFGQDTIPKVAYKTLKNTISVNVTLEAEVFFIYERYLNKLNTLEITYGFKQGNREESTLTYKTDQTQFYGGNAFQIGYRRYLTSRDLYKHQWYLSTACTRTILLTMYQ